MLDIADAIESAALAGTVNTAVALRLLPQYSERWQKHEEWRASLSNKEKNMGNMTYVVEMQSAETTGKVPERIEASTSKRRKII